MFKKRYLLLIIIIFVFAVSAVSAEELNNSETDNFQDSIGLDESYGTFEELQNEINAVESGQTLNLTRNYKNVDGVTDRIPVKNSITINGNGFVIDANDKSGLFTINAKNVVLNDVHFMNAHDKGYGSLYWMGNEGKMVNCTFENCTCDSDSEAIYSGGGAVLWSGNMGSVVNSTFINNYATDGGAIFIASDIFTIKNCDFYNNRAWTYGAAVCVRGLNTEYIEIEDCGFYNNSLHKFSGGYGGGIQLESSLDALIRNCTFIDNYAHIGKSINFFHSSCTVENCYFLPEYDNLYYGFFNESDVKLIKNHATLSVNDTSFPYNNPPVLPISLEFGEIPLNNRSIQVNIYNDTYSKSYTLKTDDEGMVYLNNELKGLYEGTLNLNAVFEENDNFYPCNESSILIILESDGYCLNLDVDATVNQNSRIAARVTNTNKGTINKGVVTFWDDGEYLGEASVKDGLASLTFMPTAAGKHEIEGIFKNDDVSIVNTTVAYIKPGKVDLSIDDIPEVIFGDSSNFTLSVLSNSKQVNEGTVKYYVDDKLVGSSEVVNGISNLDYISDKAGSLNLLAVFEQSENFLSSNVSTTFSVLKMPTTLFAMNITFRYDEALLYSVKLLDNDGNGIEDKRVNLLVTNDSGESVSFSEVTYGFGNAVYDFTSLSGGLWHVSGSFDGDENYIGSNLSDVHAIIKIDTQTKINKFNTHYVGDIIPLSSDVYDKYDANVTEGLVHYYIDDVEIGSIDLGKHSGSYVNYTPDKEGNYTLKVVYEGTDIYKPSNDTFDFEVKKERLFVLSARDVTKYYGGSERFVVSLKYLDGKAIENATVHITINGKTYNRTTDKDGLASMALNLNSGVYEIISEYNGTNVYTTVTVKSTINGDDVTKMYRNGTQYYARFIDSEGNALKNTMVKFNINGVFYERSTNDEGVARLNINLNPDIYILTALNPSTGESGSNNVTVLSSIVENYDLTKYYKNASKYSFRLLDDQGNPLGAGVNATININGVFYTRTTNESGYVNLNINLNPDTYIATIQYNGLQMSNTVKVLPILSAKDISMKYRDGTKFEAKLLDGQGKPHANQKVTFNINGVFYDRVTDDGGIARLNINLMAGEYIITSMYENGASISNKVTIRG